MEGAGFCYPSITSGELSGGRGLQDALAASTSLNSGLSPLSSSTCEEKYSVVLSYCRLASLKFAS
jgi:hypothetical protein